MSADRNLLFGILAVQLDFVTKDALIAAMGDWLLDKNKPIGDILRDQGHLSPEQLQLLSALVTEHLRQHGDVPRQSLAALSKVPPTLRQQLTELPDDAVRLSVAQVPEERPGSDALFTSPQPLPSPGMRYRILRPHARGGLGEVFVAEDTELGRSVALKEIQGRYAADPASRDRFVREAEITGGLEHPGVVPVYGLGTYADGRPFYAMRFIKGDNLKQSIGRFHSGENDSRFDSLEFRELLRRFVDVCNAVAYSHSRGVLHRDLKPGNIMLGKYGETLVVDWGLAKPVGRRDGEGGDEATLQPRSGGDSSATLFGQALGTPAYMSPEQAAGRLDELGPGTDVYSLGATLYEILTGRPPFQDVDLEAVQKGEFPRPQWVNPKVPRPLAAVCQKAMARQPADRYGSALELSREIERWLADEPVMAWPEPWGVRSWRWVRRHRTPVTGAAALVLATAVGLGLLAAERERARKAVADEQAVTARERDEKGAALETAERRLAQVKRGIEILSSIFINVNPRTVDEKDKPLRYVLGQQLERAAGQLLTEDVGDPLDIARLQQKLGLTQLYLGYPAPAVELFAKARATFDARLGPDHADTLESMSSLAGAYEKAGKLDLAVPLFEETLERRRAKLGPDHPDTLTSMDNLAGGYHSVGKFDRAVALLEQAVKGRRAKLGPDDPSTLLSVNNLAEAYKAAGKPDAAVPLYEQTLPLMRAKLGPDHQLTLLVMGNLASGYQTVGRFDRAMPLLKETLALRKAKLGPDDPDTLTSQNNLAVAYLEGAQPALAIPLLEEVLTARKRRPGPDHPETLSTMNNLAGAYHATGRLDRAMPLLEETYRLTKAKLGPEHPDTLQSMNNLAVGYKSLNKFDLALPMIEETLRLQTTTLGPEHPDTLTAMDNLADTRFAAGKFDSAIKLFEETLRLRRAKLGPDHPSTLKTLNNLGWCYKAAGKPEQGLPLLLETYRRKSATLGPDHPETATTAVNLGLTYLAANKPDGAIPFFQAFLAGKRKQLGDSLELAGYQQLVATDLLKAGRPAAAEPILRNCLAIREKLQPPPLVRANTRLMLGEALLGQKKYADAEPLLLSGYDEMKRQEASIPKERKGRLTEAVQLLVRLYEATGTKDKADLWRKKQDEAKMPAAKAP